GRRRTQPIWKFFDPSPDHFLTSLVYLRNLPNFPHRQNRNFFDCGAWSYKNDILPRWTPQQCVDAYARVARKSDLVAAPDHIVLQQHSPEVASKRIQITLDYATEFLELSKSFDYSPVAVVHGNSIKDRMR